jgi:aspartokinase-like uncharacterized kinase
VTRSLAVVKVGGSLYDLPDLGPRLRAWLKQAPGSDVLLVPGGGPTADAIRSFDRTHHLGEKRAHGLALEALQLNALFLAMLVPGPEFIEWWDELRVERLRSDGARTFFLDALKFTGRDEQVHPDDALPQGWSATSDSIAARAAVVSGADHLIVLKSVTIPAGMNWEEAGDRGFVDDCFTWALRKAPPWLRVQAVNFREWRP